MNYLVHLYLSDAEPGCLVGTLMGDFVKGQIDHRIPKAFRKGLWLHRQVDVFAHGNPHFLQSKRRIDDSFRYFKPVLVDIFYDHFLARDWSLYSPVPLEKFASDIYRLLEKNFSILPAGLQEVAPRMIRHNWLVSYSEEDIIERVFERLARRLSRPNPLANGGDELRRNYEGLRGDFQEFLTEAGDFIAGLLREKNVPGEKDR